MQNLPACVTVCVTVYVHLSGGGGAPYLLADSQSVRNTYACLTSEWHRY